MGATRALRYFLNEEEGEDDDGLAELHGAEGAVEEQRKLVGLAQGGGGGVGLEPDVDGCVGACARTLRTRVSALRATTSPGDQTPFFVDPKKQGTNLSRNA